MKYAQKGEITVIVIVMVAMMAWMMSRGMGMMGMTHSNSHTEHSADSGLPVKAEAAASSVSATSSDRTNAQ